MGTLCDSGKLGNQNTEKAIEWFSLSADQKYATGEHGLALVLASNSWKEQDNKLIFRLFKKVVEQVYAPSRFFVGYLTKKG